MLRAVAFLLYCKSYCMRKIKREREGEAACCEIQKQNDKTRTGEGVKEKKRMEMPQGED